MLSASTDNKIILDKENAFFTNFNYTDTLKRVYNVTDDKILYIHGNVTKGTELIVGHNRTYEEINSEYKIEIPEPPENLCDIDLEDWYNHISEEGETYEYRSVREEVVSQISSLRKDTTDIIPKNKGVFESLCGVNHIYVYGFSFSPIDTPYLDEVLSHIDKCKVQWTVSYYVEDDKEREEAYYKEKNIKISLVNYVELKDLILVKQTKIPFEIE